MSLEFDRPSEFLAAELNEVAGAARDLLASLDGRLNAPLPIDFPKGQLADICRSLTQLPAGTAEGCRAPLEYARNRLPAIRREHVRISSPSSTQDDDTLTRGTVIDTRLGALITSVSTALDEYRRAAANEDVPEPPPEAGSKVPTEAMEHVLQGARALEERVKTAKSDLKDIIRPESDQADTISRQLEDVDSLNRLGVAEIQMPKAIPSWIKKTTGALKSYPAILKKSMEKMRVGIDIIQVAYDRWHEFSHNSMHFLFDELRKTTRAADRIAIILEGRHGKEGVHGKQVKPQSLREAAVRILAENGNPMTAKQILFELEGSEILAKAKLPATKPYKGIYSSLTHRERTIGDVIRVGTGYWALSEWIKKGDLKKIQIARRAPARKQHAEKTKIGMHKAKKAGRRLGQPPKLTLEKVELAKKLYADGMKRHAIAEQLGVATSTIVKIIPWNKRTPKD